MTKVLSEIQRRTFSQRLVALEYLHPGYADKYERLERRLCADGTAIIVPPWPMRYLGLALSPRGGYYSGVIHPIPGQASACHQNIAALYRAGEICSIATGFGLSGDGLWARTFLGY